MATPPRVARVWIEDGCIGSGACARAVPDVFCMVATGTSGANEGLAIAEQVAEAMAVPFVLDGDEVFLTFSTGVAMSGMADMISAAYRSTILQVAAPDQLRGRIQGVFIVVVAGGPRAGDFVAGSMASAFGERVALVVGGLACIAGVLLAVVAQRRFLRYDSAHPAP